MRVTEDSLELSSECLEMNAASTSTAVTEGAGAKRWFDNPYEDYEASGGGPVVIDREGLKKQALDMLDTAFIRGVGSGVGAVYAGAVGVAYSYIHIRDSPALTSKERNRFYALACSAFHTQSSYYMANRVNRTDLCGFLLGKGGYFVVGAALGQDMANQQFSNGWINNFVHSAQLCKPIDFLKQGSDELFLGRAGYLCAALWLQKNLEYMPIPKEDLYEVWNSIIESGKNYAEMHKSPCPLMYSYYGTDYLGAGHGLSSILQVLMSFPVFMRENQEAAGLIKQTVDYFITLQDSDGNFPCVLGDAEAEILQWCHGASGIVYMFAKAYLRYKDVRYLDVCIKIGEIVWKQGLLVNGAGICHGIAGNGYVFLTLYNLLEGRDPKYLYRAAKFAEFLKHPSCKVRRPKYPFSLFQGSVGTACFLIDLLTPQRAEFPFFSLKNDYNPPSFY